MKVGAVDKNIIFAGRGGVWLRRYGLVVGAYLLATWLTDPYFMGDTWAYVESVLAHQQGFDYLHTTNSFWEFGHLFWRPLGWLAYITLRPVTYLWAGADEYANATLSLIILSWVAGLISVLLVHKLLNIFIRQEWIVNLVTLALLFSNAFLNYAQTGCSYVPGLALVLFSFYVLLRDGEKHERRLRTSLLAGASLAGAVGLWFPYALAIPAALAAPLLLQGWNKERLRLALHTGIVAAVVLILSYGIVVLSLGIYTVAGFKAWMVESSHGERATKGVLRLIFSLARSVINMGNDGLLFKRYLVHDPLNPVSLVDLFRLSLWKVACFYLFLAATLVNLFLTRRGKNVLGLLCLNSLPVLVFALFIFEAGSLERYMPMLPALLLAIAFSLSGERTLRPLKLVAVAFIAIFALVNLNAMRVDALGRQQEQVTARIRDLQPRLKPHSLVVTTHLQDELVSFNYDFPFNEINRRGNLRVTSLMEISVDTVLTWRQDFAQRALSAWEAGGDIWLSKRIFAERPRPEWNWVEGDDGRVSWADFAPFFATLEMGEAVGGEDGFVLLLPSPSNKQILETTIQTNREEK
ncbi:MAG: hypothetical protein QOH25_833 [Acidobacteriota bacterium]|jgi:hypothetical protein|nr:hypothetical protein [Acidobacteriota bacterium]